MLKILQVRLRQHLNRELSDVEAEFGKQQWSQDWEKSVFIPIPKKDSV